MSEYMQGSHTERQRKTKENVEGRPVGARRSGGRWRGSNTDDDDVYYYICWRLKLEGGEAQEREVGFIENTAMRHRRGG